jgi:hypothetical protein
VTEETRTLVRYRLSRAKEALEEAVLLLESDHTHTLPFPQYPGQPRVYQIMVLTCQELL